MKEAFYFSHDYTARNDQKILTLRGDFGLEGYALYFMVLESMAEESDGYIYRGAIGGLGVSYGVTKEKLLAFIEKSIEIGLFIEDEHGIFSKRMIEHKGYRKTLSEQGKLGAEKRWKNSRPISPPNAKERKGKERKLKEKKEQDFDFKKEKIEELKGKTSEGTALYRLCDFLESLGDKLEEELKEDFADNVYQDIKGYYEKMGNTVFISEMDAFINWHTDKGTIFKDTRGRLRTWFSKK